MIRVEIKNHTGEAHVIECDAVAVVAVLEAGVRVDVIESRRVDLDWRLLDEVQDFARRVRALVHLAGRRDKSRAVTLRP